MNRRGNGVGLFEVAYTNEPNMHIRNPLPICNFPSVLVHTLSIITHTHTLTRTDLTRETRPRER